MQLFRTAVWMVIFTIACISDIYAARPNTTSTLTTYSYNPPRVRMNIDGATDTIRIFIMADSHLWMSDEREEPFRQFSKRMASAFHNTKHYANGRPTSPEESFREVVELARKRGADAIALLGDIVSYPSEAAVEWAVDILEQSGIPYYYTPGNHDWHYEGMAGGRIALRKTWREKRLLPLFDGNNPDCYAVNIGGVKLLFIDSSTYDILPRQYEWTRREINDGKPFILMMHIPMYAPGRPVGYGIGHPDWDATHDNGWKTERRERWPKGGHKAVDFAFHKLITTAPNLVASFAGHVHTYGCDIICGKPHFTVQMNARGGYYEVDIYPATHQR
ncbi:MAG: metallophosphoesterase [Rikenellaceae bacterium]|nr:metallophosphoesterase [Rikenellaceae bacterium]